MPYRLPLLALALLCAAAALAAPTAPAGRLDGALKIDGVLDEPAWAAAAWQTGFVSASAAAEGAPKPVAVQTRFAVLYDGDALYLAVECAEPEPEKIAARYREHDNDVYQDDCLELFLDPAGEGRYYHHFVVNTNGAWYDDYGADYGLVHAKLWECPLQVGTRLDVAGRKWQAEVRLPFAALTLTDTVKPDWLLNVTRERYAGGKLELSTWSPLKGNFHAPKLFGTLTGVQADFSRFRFAVAEPRMTVAGDGSGRSRLDLRTTVSNLSGRAQRLTVSAAPFLAAPGAATEPLDLAPGASAEVTLPPVRVSGDLKAAAVQITVAEAGSGQPLKIAVKHLDAEYRPLAARILQPAYRQNIYATQKVPNLVFEVALAPDVAARTARVVYSLHDEADKPVREGKAAGAALQQPRTLEVGTLPVGRYTLRLRALDKGDQTLSEYGTVIRKLPPAPGAEVRVDEQRNLLVNGRPQVFIGWYGGIPYEDPRPEVIALQNLVTPVVLPGVAPADLAGVRSNYAEHGVYSIVEISPGRLYHTFKLWQKPGNTVAEEIKKLSAPSEEMRGYLQQVVAAVRGEPGVIGYYLADEPEINDARSDWLEATYAYMQELDPYHPVMITNDTLDGIVTHGYRACDILSPDPYSEAWDYVPNFLKRVLEVAPVGKATLMTPWASSGQAHFTQVWGTAPPYPYKVMRNQYLVSICYGCRGWTGYTTPFFMPEPVLRYGLPPIWREVRFLEPAMANPREKPQVAADAELASWLGEAGGKLYLLVVNHKPGSRTAKISHPLLAKVRTLEVVSEGRRAAVAGGSFTDSFAEGDAHLYTTDPAGAKLPTTAAVEREIAAREAECIKPGNLLHVSRGVRARSSDGYYAPWFTQFYYYAINGVTDDLGWNLSHTDKPGWLELALPGQQQVGRVVVYTPNLQDFDVQLQAADGATQVAEVRGNLQPVVELSFAAAVPTLKLRVTALAVRPGAEPARAVIREIEAYQEAGQGPATPLRAAAAAGPAPTYTTPAAETAGDPVLWREDFTSFHPAEKYNWDGKDTSWVLSPAALRAEPLPGGGLTIACKAAVGYAGMSHIFPYSKDYRYFQVKLRDIEARGYRWAVVGFGSSSGKPGYRGAVHTLHPGIYTVDTHYVHDSFRTGEATTAFLTVSAAGSAKQPDGSVLAGPQFTYDWLQLVRRPVDGLIVTLADGSPLPETLKAGDTLLFRLLLEKPAVDATVETQVGASYGPVALNGEPYVQLQQVGAKDGREWAATVTLGKGTTKADGTKGYPVLFRAVLTGGAIPATMVTASVRFD